MMQVQKTNFTFKELIIKLTLTKTHQGGDSDFGISTEVTKIREKKKQTVPALKKFKI